MKVTEHNMDCDLNASEIQQIIDLVMREIKSYPDDVETQMYYAKILGKLLGLKQTMDS